MRLTYRFSSTLLCMLLSLIATTSDAIKIPQLALAQQTTESESESEVDRLLQQGEMYESSGQYLQALESYQQALAVAEETGYRDSRGLLLERIGGVYDILGQYPLKALESYQQALAIFQETGDRNREGSLLDRIGGVYWQLGQESQAFEYWQQALTIAQETGDRNREVILLSMIGDFLGQNPQALEYYQQALAVAQEMDDGYAEATILEAIGGLYEASTQYPQALESYQQALAVVQEGNLTGNYFISLSILRNMGGLYSTIGQYPQALESYQQALAIARETGNREEEGQILSTMGYVLEDQQQPEQAIEFLMQAVEVYEAIRNDNRALPQEQQNYSPFVDDTYRALANLLIQENRASEAQQVLDLLQQ